MIRLAMALVLPALLLAGCQKEAAKKDQRTASGEVLPGSISDAMIPLDTVTSQPPLLKVAPAPAATDTDAADAADGETPGDAPAIADQPAGASGN